MTNDKINVILPYEKQEEYYVESLGDLPAKPFYDFVKRFFDILFSALGLIIFLIPMGVIAVCIKITTEGKIFYQQERLGKYGKKFNIIKFRTMIENAERDGAQWSIDSDDVRVTKIGKILRKSHLDELPQFICILKGDMSFVGPRPERECFYNEFETYIHGFSERLKVKPGLTGAAQVHRNFKMKPEEKIQYDVEYIKNRRLLKDLKLILQTIHVIIKKIEHK